VGKPHPKAALVGHSNVLQAKGTRSERICPRCDVGEVEDQLHGCMTVQFWENFIGSRNVHVERAAEVFLFR